MRLLIPLLIAAAAWMPQDDYSFMWWANGWDRPPSEGARVLCVQTNHYGVVVDAKAPNILHFGPIHAAAPYAEAALQDNQSVFGLPKAALELSVTSGGTVYRCVAAARDETDRMTFPIRLIDSGRFVQRIDIHQLVFKNDAGESLNADGRLELVAWPDRLALTLEVAPREKLGGGSLDIRLRTDAGECAATQARDTFQPNRAHQAVLTWRADGDTDAPPVEVRVSDMREADAALPVRFDSSLGCHVVDLPERNWNIAAEPDRLDRFGLKLVNTSAEPATCRLLFTLEDSFPGVTGLSPMLRDSEGNPTGIPVQISKNWHRQEDKRLLYEGPWFHGYTMLTLPPGETRTGEFDIAYARWGGVPAVSHAQLCLIGWGTNQRWDQVAIGSWGESICYDPDINLERSMIDDVRPLMVTSMGASQAKWGWTCNVGGGDFLVYEDKEGTRQPLVDMRAAYLAYGPNLTRAVYAGTTADGNIRARIEVSSPRCDDINRSYHRIRYDVLKSTPFKRLAFYQVGADRYNDHQFGRIALGNAADGLIEEWDCPQGGRMYHRTAMPCEGPMPWFSLHEGQRNAHHPHGAWANRGLVVRSWRARLFGQDVPVPHAWVYGTDNGVPSANVELGPPDGTDTLQPGDFVEADVEFIVLPQHACDYYGPNEALRSHLVEHGNAWQPVHRQSVGNDLRVDVSRGELTRPYPIEIAVDDEDTAEFEVTGGIGYVPMAFTGLWHHSGHTLCRKEDGRNTPIDQSVHGNDFWQTDWDPRSRSWSVTYNVSLDSPGDQRQSRHFVFQSIRP
jgi:hypothetical protein